MENREEQQRALPQGSLLKRRYRIESVLGTGASGVTYEAFDTLARRPVAVKEFFPARLCARAADTDTLSPLDRESGTQFFLSSEAFLSQHGALTQAAGSRSVVTVYDAFFENGTSYAVMELLMGVTLAAYMQRVRRRLSAGEAVTLLTELSNALLVVHSLSMLHGDIAPENVFISSDGAVKLFDFGAARETLRQHRAADNTQVTADIRALGRMVCTLLTGRPAPSDPSPLYAFLPTSLASVLERMLTADDSLRFDSVFALLHAVNCLDIPPAPFVIPAPRREETATPVRRDAPADKPRPARSRTRKRARLILVVGGLLLALFIVLIIALASKA